MALWALDDIPAQARRIEAAGFDFVHCGEHVQGRNDVFNSFVALSAAGAATSRIGLMSTVVLLPLYPAALAAKLAAAVDVASGGRYCMGVGVGGELPDEFDACGVPLSERGARTDEAIEVIRLLWREDEAAFDGRFNHFSHLSIHPRPVTRPHPAIWVAGRRTAAMRRAARLGDGWLPYMYSPEMLAESLTEIATLGEAVGRPKRPAAGIWLPLCCHQDRATARRWVTDALSRRYRQDFTALAPRYAVFGTEEDCRRRVQEYVDAGATTVALVAMGPDDQLAHTVDAFSRLLPAGQALVS
jgi:probable F420-dependent oxidoreductase